MADRKQKTSFALSEKARQLLAGLAEHYGISQTAVLEVVIRERAERQGVRLPDDGPTDDAGSHEGPS